MPTSSLFFNFSKKMVNFLKSVIALEDTCTVWQSKGASHFHDLTLFLFLIVPFSI